MSKCRFLEGPCLKCSSSYPLSLSGGPSRPLIPPEQSLPLPFFCFVRFSMLLRGYMGVSQPSPLLEAVLRPPPGYSLWSLADCIQSPPSWKALTFHVLWILTSPPKIICMWGLEGGDRGSARTPGEGPVVLSPLLLWSNNSFIAIPTGYTTPLPLWFLFIFSPEPEQSLVLMVTGCSRYIQRKRPYCGHCHHLILSTHSSLVGSPSNTASLWTLNCHLSGSWFLAFMTMTLFKIAYKQSDQLSLNLHLSDIFS